MKQGEELYGVAYEKGEVVFREGEAGDAMYIVQSGAVEVTRREQGRDVVLALLEKGDCFGEMALISTEPRSATVTAICRSRLLSLSRTSLLDRIQEDPSVAIHLLRTLCQRIEQTNRLLRQTIESDETLLSALRTHRERDPFGSFAAVPTPQLALVGKGGLLQADYLAKLKEVFEREVHPWYEPGQSIVREGETGNAIYILMDGLVEVSQEVHGEKHILACLAPYDFFGEMALISGRPRTATVTVMRRARLLPIRRDGFLDRIRKEPDLALILLQTLVARLALTLQSLSRPEASMDIIVRSVPPRLRKDARISLSLVSLSACGGCIVELLGEREASSDLLARTRIVYSPMLMDADRIEETDLAIVDGAVRMEYEVEKLKEVRRKSRYLVAWGTCAAFGGVPAMANQYELEELIEESYSGAENAYSYYLSGKAGVEAGTYQRGDTALLRRVRKLDDVVKVDYYLPGCPPQLANLTDLIKELRGEEHTAKVPKIVCSECDRKSQRRPIQELVVFPNRRSRREVCFHSEGVVCMGSLTRGGCGAVCPKGGLPCWGCRGPSAASLREMTAGESLEGVLLGSMVRRCRLPYEQIEPVLRILGIRCNTLLRYDPYFVYERSRLR